MERVQLVAATFATAVILAGPASAGVVRVEPEGGRKLKKAFYDDGKPAMVVDVATAPYVPTAPAPKTPGPEFTIFDPQFLILPGAIGAIGAVAFAFVKLDDGFVDFMVESSVRDSASFVGYEPALKPDSGAINFKEFGVGTPKIKANLAAAAKRTTGNRKKGTTVTKAGTSRMSVSSQDEGTGFSFPSFPNPFAAAEEEVVVKKSGFKNPFSKNE
ncbi:MAG: hypothetical protein WDW36_006985 [Sanguina aurantia]